MPILYILGGANGVGKSTWYSTGMKNGYVNPGLPFLNSDNIQKELGGFTPENVMLAEEMLKNLLKEVISRKENFMIESNLARMADYEWINRIRKEGYQTSLFFFGTDDVRVNKGRVLQRVKEGGHGVPEPIIEHRYRMGLSYLKREMLLLDDVILIDATGSYLMVEASVVARKIMAKKSMAPHWVDEVLFLVERLHRK